MTYSRINGSHCSQYYYHAIIYLRASTVCWGSAAGCSDSSSHCCRACSAYSSSNNDLQTKTDARLDLGLPNNTVFTCLPWDLVGTYVLVCYNTIYSMYLPIL